MAYDIILQSNNLSKKVTFVLAYAIIAFFFLLNGEALFDAWTTSWTYKTLFYIVGVSIFIGILERLPKELKRPVEDSAFGFFAAFGLSTLLFIVLRDFGLYFQETPIMPAPLVIAYLAYHGLIVAPSEEIIFRGTIFRAFYQKNWKAAYLISSGLFAAFHFAAYGGSIQMMIVAFAIGLILCYCTDRWNIGVAIGIHWAYNAAATGATLF